jgi:hypothetical protein
VSTGYADFRGWAGQSSGWQYLAQRIDPTGAVSTWLGNELPLQSVVITDVLSGPTQITATIDPAYRSMKGSDGLPIFGEWSTAIYAECDGIIRAGALVAGLGMAGSKLSLDCTGFTTVAKGLSYPSQKLYSFADPISITRDIWNVIQSDPDTNVGLVLDPYTTTNGQVQVGGPVVAATATPAASSSETTINTTAGTDDKPYELNWWSTHDLGGEIDKLAQNAPFDYHERHVWVNNQIAHFLDFGYPTIGRRREYLRFVIGENIQVLPEPHEVGDTFANHAVVLGAGEGSAMIRGEARRRDGRVRRMVIIDDKTITDQAHASRAAQLELARRNQVINLDSLVVRNTPHAPLGSFAVGDEIRLMGSVDWMDTLDMWVRITSMSINPEKPDMMGLSVVRSDWVV